MKPADLFDRNVEWADLERFVSSEAPGLRIGVLYGRRRLGKSFLLRRLAQAHHGIYHMAVEEEQGPALQRFVDSVGMARGLNRGDLAVRDWEHALRQALSGPEPLVVIDELPYLLAHPQGASIPSLLQQMVDESRSAGQPDKKRVILCGSALAVMSELLSGSKPLRGRAELDLLLRPFDYRTVAGYYGIEDPETAFRLYSIFGGVPGYRDLLGARSPQTLSELQELVLDTVCNPSHALFTEPAYLLREDPRIRDRALYFSILSAVAAGAKTPSKIGGVVGRDARSLAHPLEVLISAGFLTREEDLLNQRRPSLRVSDRIVQFHDLVVSPRLSLFEDRRPGPAWGDSQTSLRAQLYGPAFEALSREWVRRYAGEETLGGAVGEVGTTVVNDSREKAQHEVDVLALAAGQRKWAARPVVRVIGEAKDADQVRTASDVDRLEKIRSLLVGKGAEASDAKLMLFARSGFSPDVEQAAAAREDLELVDLQRIHSGV